MQEIHTLHILNKAPDHRRFGECLGMLGPDDAVVLTENGVLGLTTASTRFPSGVYALNADLAARGLPKEGLGAINIDYPELVELSLNAERVISW